ncbi:hypothetical protein CRE_21406 [Caenorhabditis remanei]|uniref:Phlebovirus glycoprotein G2 fusion domain-containing protein n=1 Tax=Caenorhabditis remanei TaxID=31234 RepID=E3MUS2_CAERE|nr:hypothetical protein CRE_21406 [Caenorhabditis remanei]
MCIHAMCCVPIKMSDVLKLGYQIVTAMSMILAIVFNWTRKPRKAKWRELLITIILLILLQHVSKISSCQEIDVVNQQETICDTEGICIMVTEEIMRLNTFHKEGCLRLEKNGTTIRDIRIEMIEVELHCIKKSIAFTQNVETKVWSTKRCPRMGSCIQDKCMNVTKDTVLPELKEVNHYVGNVGCAESCGGPGCGCFFVSSGCLFFKTYATPKLRTSCKSQGDNHRLDKIKSVADIRSVLPGDVCDVDPSIMRELLEKSVALHNP